MKLVNQALNKIRIQAQVKIKGSRFLLLKNGTDLTETEIAQVEQILAQSPCLKIAYLMVRIQVFDWGIREGMKKLQEWADIASRKKATALLP